MSYVKVLAFRKFFLYPFSTLNMSIGYEHFNLQTLVLNLLYTPYYNHGQNISEKL